MIEHGKTAADPGWQAEEPQFLSAVEKHLATFLGPLAGIIVRRTASKANDPGELLTNLAATLQAESDRKAFLARKNEFFRILTHVRPMKVSSPAARHAGTTGIQRLADASGAAQLTPAAVRHASELLARHVGPLARVLTERAAKSASNVRDLYSMLAEHLQDQTERAQFLAEAGFPES